jgi:RecB family endonuclease NucS
MNKNATMTKLQFLETGFPDEKTMARYLEKNLGLIELGLRPYIEDGSSCEVCCQTRAGSAPVGRMDILARDRKGRIVVIECKRLLARATAVGQMLAYIAWVKRYLAGPVPVRGIIVACGVAESARIALSLLPDLAIAVYRCSNRDRLVRLV